MLTAAQRGLILVGLLASALSTGFFYTYSISAMPGLNAADPQSAIRAMQGINSVIRTPTFAFAFFGALFFPSACAILAWLGSDPRVAVFSALAAITYGIGVFGVTFLVNVPLNEALAQANLTNETATRIWAEYQQPWTAWNHVRAVCASVAFSFMAIAAILHFSPGRR